MDPILLFSSVVLVLAVTTAWLAQGRKAARNQQHPPIDHPVKNVLGSDFSHLNALDQTQRVEGNQYSLKVESPRLQSRPITSRPRSGLHQEEILTVWRPLSKRADKRSDHETLCEGVPIHLRDPLLHWLECQFYDYLNLELRTSWVLADTEASEAKALRIANLLRIQLPKESTVHSYARLHRPLFTKGLLSLAQQVEDGLLLDIIDSALADQQYHPSNYETYEHRKTPNRPADLDALLRDGGSIYRVNDQGAGLERRVDDAIIQTVRQVLGKAEASSRHLQIAWQAAYGIKPNPTQAYSEAVKAIEASLIPLVLPADHKATLGKVIRHLRDTAEKWELAIYNEQASPATIEPLVELIDLVWRGHRDRHAGTATAVTVDATAAEMAMHAAATVVQWLSCGGLRSRL